MFTDDSVNLRHYFFPRIILKNSIELQDLYNYFEGIFISPILKRKYRKESKKRRIEIDLSTGAESIIQKTYLFSNTHVQFTIGNIHVTINLYSDTVQKSLIEEVTKIVQFVGSLSTSMIQKLVLNIYLIDQKKKNTSKMKQFGKNEINSGACQRGDTTIITIYREEELFKVCIHELIHAFQYDNYEDNHQIIQWYQKKYNITSDHINTNEAYTEIWANLINCYLISQKVGRNRYNLFLILIALEKEFVKFQAEKIIYLTGMNGKEIDINKETNILSYFIIRHELYEKLNLFLKFCKKHNEDYIKLKDENKWFELLKKNYKMKKNKRRFNNMNKRDYLFSTMRMSLNELDIYAFVNTPSLLG